MKASELIVKLQKMIDDYGDHFVCDGEYFKIDNVSLEETSRFPPVFVLD